MSCCCKYHRYPKAHTYSFIIFLLPFSFAGSQTILTVGKCLFCRCFLSDDTQPVAIIIKNILQCVLNFRQCFFGGGLHVASDVDSSSLLSRINFTQVFFTFLLTVQSAMLINILCLGYANFGAGKWKLIFSFKHVLYRLHDTLAITPQVLAVKATFEKNINDLYLLYLKSPKHGESSICRFWDLLNYNNFYSTIFNKGTQYFSL